MGRRRSRRNVRSRSDDIYDVKPDIVCNVRMQTVAEATAHVRNAVTTASRTKGVVIDVITGKGQNSPGGKSRLKPPIRRLLEGELAPLIKEWCINTDDSGFLVRMK